MSKQTPLPTSVSLRCGGVAPAQVDQARRARAGPADGMDRRDSWPRAASSPTIDAAARRRSAGRRPPTASAQLCGPEVVGGRVDQVAREPGGLGDCWAAAARRRPAGSDEPRLLGLVAADSGRSDRRPAPSPARRRSAGRVPPVVEPPGARPGSAACSAAASQGSGRSPHTSSARSSVRPADPAAVATAPGLALKPVAASQARCARSADPPASRRYAVRRTTCTGRPGYRSAAKQASMSASFRVPPLSAIRCRAWCRRSRVACGSSPTLALLLHHLGRARARRSRRCRASASVLRRPRRRACRSPSQPRAARRRDRRRRRPAARTWPRRPRPAASAAATGRSSSSMPPRRARRRIASPCRSSRARVSARGAVLRAGRAWRRAVR